MFYGEKTKHLIVFKLLLHLMYSIPNPVAPLCTCTSRLKNTDENTSIEHTSKEQKNHIFNFLSLIKQTVEENQSIMIQAVKHIQYMYKKISHYGTGFQPGDDLKTSLRHFVRSWVSYIFCFHTFVFEAIKIKFKTISARNLAQPFPRL